MSGLARLIWEATTAGACETGPAADYCDTLGTWSGGLFACEAHPGEGYGAPYVWHDCDPDMTRRGRSLR